MNPSNFITQVQRPTKPLIVPLKTHNIQTASVSNESIHNESLPDRDLVNSPRGVGVTGTETVVGLASSSISSTTTTSTTVSTAVPVSVTVVHPTPHIQPNNQNDNLPSNEYEEIDNTDSDYIDHVVNEEGDLPPPPPAPPPLTTPPVVPWQHDHLLPPLMNPTGKKCLVLDLDETLVHSSFQPTTCDFEIPLQLEGQLFKVYVAKRPFVDEFMKACGRLYEVVVFTASLAAYADAVLDLLDIHKVVDWRLFRESCSSVTGSYVKDLRRIGRSINEIIIIDNSPHSYAFNPLNAIPIQSWFDDQEDKELLTLIPILERLAEPTVTDVKTEIQLMVEVSGLELLASTLTHIGLNEEEEQEYVDRYDQQL